MKKTYSSTDIHQNQGQELSKKLYRTISELAKSLDDARSYARNIGDLFSPNLQIQRRKFCEYCERLIFSDPILYGKKGEELLWRKGYYDIISTAKKLKKKEYLPNEISNIQTHINAGIGYYHHLILKLQYEFNLDLKNCIDFAAINDVRKEEKKDCKNNNSEVITWAKQSVHQCLIYLGDLSRYKLEIYPNWEPTLAIRYYLQAVSYKPDYGMPHNQMGTLAMNQNLFLDAVYHYIRCMACKFSFEGTINNLHSLFDKNSKFIEQLPKEDQNADCIIEPSKSENIKGFLARFLLLIDIWYFNKKVTRVYSLCHQIYKNLEQCLTYIKPTSSESGDSPADLDSLEAEPIAPYLTSDMLFKIVIICLLCISKLRADNSSHLSTVIAFTLAIYSQLIQNITSHIQESVLNYPLTEGVTISKTNGILKDLMIGGKKRSKTKFRRRKALKVESDDEESERSGNEDDNYSSSDDSFISDTEDTFPESSDEELDIIKISDESICGTPKEPVIKTLQNGFKSPITTIPDEQKMKSEIIGKIQLMDVNDMLEIVTEEATLQSIKILNDWLRHDPEVLKSCGTNTRTLLKQITYLLNLININLNHPKIIGVNRKLSEIIYKHNKLPLSEDVILKGTEILKEAHKDLDWSYIQKREVTAREEAVIRIIKLMSFGKFLTTIEETGVTFKEDQNIFVCSSDEKKLDDDRTSVAIMDELELQEAESGGSFIGKPNNNRSTNDNGSKGGQLTKMKHMGQLWLAAEVRALESRVGGKAALSPYLVLDADALIKYTFMVKHLVHSRKFIVLVPTAVVSALDDLKREKIEARDAIRWLESQFHRGNRFFRAQRAQERAPIPFIKYPKKKDKEMHVYIQIIECCHFLAEQQKGASNVVTLLIGNQNVLSNGENKEFSYVGLAKSAGVAIESITSFYSKWKKSKGKR